MRSTILVLTALFTATLGQTPSLSELIQSHPDLSILLDALSIVPDLATVLSGLTDITILAPTNSGFEALLAQGPNQENIAINDRIPDSVGTLLAYHVINGTFTSSDFTEIPTYVRTIFN
ncbi:hypothetical protein K458DRAFT_394470 [Lentithecium fluviatile CBS 122367]|uniref:FAS1 domain-containing protein n=1 Tax=Lentithecium fluviatile CBS 122367 TaxID=1168545 RepID=A0A6G1IKQ0_9PLEO|nr:hypothetical protein K458DRAFT_394470 [Lentithecium fluviatile CBS 122367]